MLETADGKFVTPESIQESLDRIDDAKQKVFISLIFSSFFVKTNSNYCLNDKYGFV